MLDRSQLKYLKRHTQKYMDKLTEQQQADKLAFEKSLDEVHTLEFTKRQLLFIATVLTKIEFVYGDFLQADPIIRKLEPIVSAEPPKSEVIA